MNAMTVVIANTFDGGMQLMRTKLDKDGAVRINFYLDAETVRDMDWLAAMLSQGDIGRAKNLKPNRSRLLRVLVQAEAKRAVMRGGKMAAGSVR